LAALDDVVVRLEGQDYPDDLVGLASLGLLEHLERRGALVGLLDLEGQVALVGHLARFFLEGDAI